MINLLISTYKNWRANKILEDIRQIKIDIVAYPTIDNANLLRYSEAKLYLILGRESIHYWQFNVSYFYARAICNLALDKYDGGIAMTEILKHISMKYPELMDEFCLPSFKSAL